MPKYHISVIAVTHEQAEDGTLSPVHENKLVLDVGRLDEEEVSQMQGDLIEVQSKWNGQFPKEAREAKAKAANAGQAKK